MITIIRFSPISFLFVLFLQRQESSITYFLQYISLLCHSRENGNLVSGLDRIRKKVYIIISSSTAPLSRFFLEMRTGGFSFSIFCKPNNKPTYEFACIASILRKIICVANLPIFTTQTQFGMVELIYKEKRYR